MVVQTYKQKHHNEITLKQVKSINIQTTTASIVQAVLGNLASAVTQFGLVAILVADTQLDALAYIYIYIYREREITCVYIYIYTHMYEYKQTNIYIYIYI